MIPNTIHHDLSTEGIRPLWDSLTTATFLVIPPATLDAWAHRGLGPVYAKIGKHRRYDQRDVMAFVEANRRGGDAAAGTQRDAGPGRRSRVAAPDNARSGQLLPKPGGNDGDAA